MKFKGVMTELICMRQFSGTITTLSKLGKHCVVRFSPDNVFFIITDDSAPRRPLAWCVLEQAHFFNQYTVIGLSERNNQIYLQFSPDLLSKALSSLRSAQTPSKSIKMKLTKKKTPCLSCEVELPTYSQQSRMCTHDIPVELIPSSGWYEYMEPKLPEFDISIEMPGLKLFKNICERMKTIGQHVIVSANRSGILSLKVENDMAKVTTHFKNLQIEAGGGDDPEQYFSARVDCKKLIGFLSIEQVNPSKVVCNIVERKMIHMHVIHEDVTLHYFIPAVAK